MSLPPEKVTIDPGPKSQAPSFWIFVLFLASGIPASIYEIVWQRSLFAIYGINIESVTIVVSAFMLGLGLGSLWGGALSRSPRFSPIRLFAVADLGQHCLVRSH
jgi:spermidine synthase